jgi:hypothetical protein
MINPDHLEFMIRISDRERDRFVELINAGLLPDAAIAQLTSERMQGNSKPTGQAS